MRTWILQRFQVYARILLMGALALSPVIFLRTTVDVFNLVKITTLWLFAILALSLWAMLSLERGVWLPRMRIFLVAGAFLLAQGLATALSQNLNMSLLGVIHRYGGLIPFLLYATIALLMVGLYWERPANLKEVAWAVAGASFVLTCYVLIQKLGLDWIPWRDSNGKPPTFPVGTMGNSNFAGGYLGIAAPLFFYVVLSTRDTFWKWIFAVAFALDLLALWFTQTRGALIGVGVAAAMLAFVSRSYLPRWLRRLSLVGAIGAGLVFILVVIHPGMRQPPGIFSAAGALSPFRTGTFQDRSYYWIAALRIFRHHPIVGTGPDTYAANYPTFRLAQDGAKLGLTITDKPHNIFFEYAADSGILGLGAYLALLGFALTYGYRRVRQLEGNARLLLMMFMGCLVAYAGQGFFSIDVPPIAVMGWVALAGIAILADPGAVAARATIEAARPGPGKRPGERGTKKRGPAARPATKAPYGGLRVVRQGPTRWLEHALLMVAALVLMVIGVRPFWADHLAHNAQVLQGAQGTTAKQVSDAYAHASGFLPLEPTYQSFAGNAWESAGGQATDPASRATDYALALGRYRNAASLQPHNVFYAMNLARVNTSWGATDPSHFATADALWRATTAIDPTDWQVHEQYAQMLSTWGDATPTDVSIRQRSVAEFQATVRINPKEVTAWVNLVKLYRALGEQTQAQAALTTARTLAPSNPDVLALIPTGTAGATSTGTASTGSVTPGG